MTRTILLASLLSLTALSTSACYVESGPPPNSPNYTPPPPAPPPPASNEVVYETEPPPPPPPQAEPPPPPSPGVDFVWVQGYHRWDGRRYVWTGGRYERRPHANARWENAHWEARGRGRVYVEGRWR